MVVPVNRGGIYFSTSITGLFLSKNGAVQRMQLLASWRRLDGGPNDVFTLLSEYQR